jgi:hypothetical protein
MEDVLEVYHRPHNPEAPVVCLDEASQQLIAETRVPIPAMRGHPARHDYEYQRNGTANLFMMFAPLEGWRHVEVTSGTPSHAGSPAMSAASSASVLASAFAQSVRSSPRARMPRSPQRIQPDLCPVAVNVK